MGGKKEDFTEEDENGMVEWFLVYTPLSLNFSVNAHTHTHTHKYI